jgi:hypothetical protein
MCGCPDQRLGVQIRRPHHHHFGQGSTTYLRYLELPLQQAGSEATTTTAYHPKSNDLVERAHKQLKEALKRRLAGAA